MCILNCVCSFSSNSKSSVNHYTKSKIDIKNWKINIKKESFKNLLWTHAFEFQILRFNNTSRFEWKDIKIFNMPHKNPAFLLNKNRDVN